MSTLVERDAVAKVQDLADEFDNAKAFKFPFTSRIPKGGAPRNAKMTYPVEKYDAPSTEGAIDEADPQEFENPSAGDAELDVRLQIWEKAVRIGSLATTTTHQAGITPRNVVARKMAKKLIELKRNMEVTQLSDNESRVDNGVVGNKTRGYVRWAQATAQAHYPVPSAYLTPATSIDAATNLADYTDSTIVNIARSQYDQIGDADTENVLFAGSLWQAQLDRSLTISVKNETNRTTIRRFNEKAGSTVSLGKVQMLETSFGNIEVQLSQHINLAGDPATDASKRLAVGGPMDNLELRFSDAAHAIPLAKRSRSTEFILTATGALIVKNPLKLIAFKPAA